MVDHPVNALLVSGDDTRRKHHSVTAFYFGVLVVVDRGAGERRHRLALGAADKNAHLLRRVFFDLAGMNQYSLGNVQVPEIQRDFGRFRHRATYQRDFALVFASHLDGQLDAMDGRRKTRDEQAPVGAGEDLVKASPHGALAGRVTAALGVGGILQQSQHVLFFAVFGKGVQIEQAIVGGSRIDFEIAGVNQHAQRSVDGQGHAVHQAVRYLDGIDGERSQVEARARANLAQIGVVQQVVLVELVLHQGQRELGAKYRHSEFGKDPRQRANMVFVAVGKDNPAHLLAVFDEVGNVGNDDINAEKLGLGEHQSRIDHDDVIAPAHGHTVHAELAQAA